MSQEKYLSVLRQYWGFEDFRGVQREIIESVGSGKDTLGLMPTGGGKSITFQVPALTMQGTCVVFTPLIALMKDQMAQLKRRGIRVAAVHSGQTREQNLAALDNCILGGYKFLYVSPERLKSDIFITKLRHMQVSFFAVDEAHCISQWGYDFRPSYLDIAQVRKLHPSAPILALTATATPRVVEDIQRNLGFREGNVFRMSFERKNLSYNVVHVHSQQDGIVQTLSGVNSGSCIIYTRNRQRCKEVADMLCAAGLSATFYHAGLTDSEKNKRQSDWQCDRVRTIVATNAFGMGIDKPDVRLVLHIDLPDTLEEYFQEAGRAGRDGKPAQAVLLLDGKETLLARRRVTQNFPAENIVADIYEKICYFLQVAEGDGLNVTREFNLQQFCRVFRFHPIMTRSALVLLERAGYISFADEEEATSRLRIYATRNELYHVLDEQAEHILNSILRHYPGIFIEYAFLDEDLVCRETGYAPDFVYHVLQSLSHDGVIDYVPRKRVPKITFLRKRVSKERIFLPDAVYKDRRQNYVEHLAAMLDYCATSECRSVVLLRYFGETDAQPCGHCDACRAAASATPDDIDTVCQTIRNKLAAGKQKAYEMDLPYAPEKIRLAMELMSAHEEIESDGLYVQLRSNPTSR